MRSLRKPAQDAGETFAICISIVRNPDMRRKLQALRLRIEAASLDYDAKGAGAEWYLIEQTGAVGLVPREELLDTYRTRMARSKTPGREVYDELIVVPQRRCPLCGQRDVSTLDHYLPESLYSLFVVAPLNLVPSCKDCNHKKRTAAPTAAEEQTFHPYYDTFDDGVWLQAELLNSNPLGVLYCVQQPIGWDETKVERARKHFEVLELAALYSDHAASELPTQ